ncbi:MAG TPA: hypothetical protein VIM99_11635, partial [Blastocatellia bacterium]
ILTQFRLNVFKDVYKVYGIEELDLEGTKSAEKEALPVHVSSSPSTFRGLIFHEGIRHHMLWGYGG